MEVIWANLPFLLKGAYYTLLITLVSMFFGSIIAVVVAIARLKGNKLVEELLELMFPSSEERQP